MGRQIHVIIDNRFAELQEPYNKKKLLPFWSHVVDGWHFMRSRYAYFDGKKWNYRWDGKISYLKYDKVPAGLFWATYQDIEKELGKQFVIHYKARAPKGRDSKYWLKSEGKYTFQNQCVDAMLGAAHRGMGGLILNATGSGKTRIAAMFASRVDCDILFVVDQLNLLEQARKDIAKHLGEEIGKVGESKFRLRRITVATRQTLAGHLSDPKFRKWLFNVEVAFIDEIHDQMNKSNFKIMNQTRPLVVFGLTATLKLTRKPIRLKAHSLTGPVLFTYPLQQGMDEDVLSKGIAMMVTYNNTIQYIEGMNRNDAYVEYIVKNEERNNLITTLVRRAYKKGKYVVVLVDRIRHLERLSRRLHSHSIPHRIAAGQFKGAKLRIRDRIRDTRHFERGEFRVIIANRVFKKGVDIKRLDVVINGAALSSENDAVQVFGRGIRKHVDKRGLLCFDIHDFDPSDKGRDQKNWFARAAKKRKRALKRAGVPIEVFVWENDGHSETLFRKAEKLLAVKKDRGH